MPAKKTEPVYVSGEVTMNFCALGYSQRWTAGGASAPQTSTSSGSISITSREPAPVEALGASTDAESAEEPSDLSTVHTFSVRQLYLSTACTHDCAQVSPC